MADGECSVVFLAGDSHAWRDLRAADSFDVSPKFDESEPYTPERSARSWAKETLRTAMDRLNVDAASLPSARVDFTERPDVSNEDNLHRGGDPLLLEPELIEPYLNLPGDDAADRLAAALLSSFELSA